MTIQNTNSKTKIAGTHQIYHEAKNDYRKQNANNNSSKSGLSTGIRRFFLALVRFLTLLLVGLLTLQVLLLFLLILFNIANGRRVQDWNRTTIQRMLLKETKKKTNTNLITRHGILRCLPTIRGGDLDRS